MRGTSLQSSSECREENVILAMVVTNLIEMRHTQTEDNEACGPFNNSFILKSDLKLRGLPHEPLKCLQLNLCCN